MREPTGGCVLAIDEGILLDALYYPESGAKTNLTVRLEPFLWALDPSGEVPGVASLGSDLHLGQESGEFRLSSEEVLPKVLSGGLAELRALRNRAVHQRDVELTPQVALDYAQA